MVLLIAYILLIHLVCLHWMRNESRYLISILSLSRSPALGFCLNSLWKCLPTWKKRFVILGEINNSDRCVRFNSVSIPRRFYRSGQTLLFWFEYEIMFGTHAHTDTYWRKWFLLERCINDFSNPSQLVCLCEWQRSIALKLTTSQSFMFVMRSSIYFP